MPCVHIASYSLSEVVQILVNEVSPCLDHKYDSCAPGMQTREYWEGYFLILPEESINVFRISQFLRTLTLKRDEPLSIIFLILSMN